MRKHYFFFDIDGTLTDPATKIIVPSAKTALRKLEAAGHFTAIASGRAHYKTIPAAEDAGLKNYVCNGGACLVIDGKMVCDEPLDHEKALAVIHQAEELGYGILVMQDDSIDVVMKNRLFLEQVGERKEPTNYILDENLVYEEIPDIFKIYVSIPAEEEYRLTTMQDLTHLRFVKDYLMFQHDEKDKGIERMVEYMHGDLADTVVFGDDLNDMVMFRKPFFSIAMGNGNDLLKQKADFVTKASVDDGIYYACETLGFFEPVDE